MIDIVLPVLKNIGSETNKNAIFDFVIAHDEN